MLRNGSLRKLFAARGRKPPNAPSGLAVRLVKRVGHVPCSGVMLPEEPSKEKNHARDVQRSLFANSDLDEARLPRRPEAPDYSRAAPPPTRPGYRRSSSNQPSLPFGRPQSPARAPTNDGTQAVDPPASPVASPATTEPHRELNLPPEPVSLGRGRQGQGAARRHPRLKAGRARCSLSRRRGSTNPLPLRRVRGRRLIHLPEPGHARVQEPLLAAARRGASLSSHR